MAYLDKEAYERRKAYADRRNAKNAEIGSLTEEQHEALAWLCAVRHELHCDWEDMFYPERSNYTTLWDYFDSDDESINSHLISAGLSPINFNSVQLDLPNEEDYYYNLSAEEREMWEDKADEFNTTASGMYHTGLSLWIEQGEEYKLFCEEMEKVNPIIESYLAEIDKKHGTSYCPTGATRIY